MADTTPETNTGEELPPGDLRKMLEESNKQQAALQAQLAQYNQDEALREQAGLGHLSKRQRGAILRELQADGKEFNPETAKEMATELGYKLTPTTPTPTTTDPAPTGDGSGGNGGGEGGQPQPDDNMTAFDVIARARAESASTRVGGDFEAEIRKAKNPEELTSLLRSKGPRHGMIHEWDVP
jgi:hypothetical protein